jgi:predicted dehydrogenase
MNTKHEDPVEAVGAKSAHPTFAFGAWTGVRRVTAAIGTDHPDLRTAYRAWLLDSPMHEFNAVRGLIGEPTELRFSDVWRGAAGVTATLAFGDMTECVFMWVDRPALTRYELEIGLFAADRRALLRFPSPHLRYVPTELVLEGDEPNDIATWRAEHTVAYEEPFERELVEFHAAVAEGRAPWTPGEDGLRDIALCQVVVRARLEGRPIVNPTSLEAG